MPLVFFRVTKNDDGVKLESELFSISNFVSPVYSVPKRINSSLWLKEIEKLVGIV